MHSSSTLNVLFRTAWELNLPIDLGVLVVDLRIRRRHWIDGMGESL